MAAKMIMILSVAVAASAVPLVPLGKLAYAEADAPAHYEFSYSVHDSHTGDVKEQKESRQGDAVQGSYSLLQPDGVQRIVDYTADKEHGFNAVVRYEGHPTSAPAKIAYAAPVAKIAYAAPVAKVAYAPAPVHYAPAPVHYAPAPLHYAPAPVHYAPAPVHYAPAPVAKLAYAAVPAAKVYTENHSHVTYSSPAISYQH